MSKLILDLIPLETRVNPAGTYTSILTGTTLILTGSDAEESIVLQDDGVGMTIQGQNGTLIDGLASKTYSTAVNSVKIVAKGGDDTIALGQLSPFSLSGKLDIDLGDSSNINGLNLITVQQITLGSLRVVAGSGLDIFSFGGSSATVNGDFTTNFGNGRCELFLQTDTTVQGNLIMRGGLGFTRLDLDGVSVKKSIAFNPGDGDSLFQASASTVSGDIKIIGGRGDDTINLSNATIKGPTGLTVLGGADSVVTSINNLDVNFMAGGIFLRSANSDATLNVNTVLKTVGSTSIIGRNSLANVNGDFQTKALTVTGPFGSRVDANGGTLTTAGDIRLTSILDSASFNLNGASLNAQGKIFVTGADAKFFASSNGTLNVAGDINITAASRLANFDRNSNSQFTFSGNVNVRGAKASFNSSSGFGDYSKNISVNALVGDLYFNVNGTVTFAKNVTISGRKSPANITMVSNTAFLLGSLSVNTGDDSDTVTISGVRVSGATSIKTAGGTDTISIDNGAKFTGSTLIDSGAGDDFLQIAQAVGLTTTAVEFNGKATIRAGTGNDHLMLGRSLTGSGDAFSLASFGAGSIVDGGSNLNTFDDELGQTAGSPTILNWTDPTP